MKMINSVTKITGEIVKNFVFNHECNGEKFYKTFLKIVRKSENSDIIPIMVSDRLLDISKDYNGLLATIVGQFRSHNNHDENKKALELFVFATEFSLGTVSEGGNFISLDGFICKTPIHRKTPLGREIADILVAVNRPYKKTDYIPCICWGRNARYVSTLAIGTEIKLEGRIQSREYLKKLDDGTQETRTAYEVSASRIEVAESEDNENDSM